MQRKGEVIGEEDDDEWYSRKLEGGLFTLQIVDYILGWICMEDDGVRLVLCDSCGLH
jgi:beta-catenin-like protein 1